MNTQTSRNGHELVRVRDKATGHHYSIPAASFDAERHAALKSDAVDANGYPLPPKYRIQKATTATTTATTATNQGQEGGQPS